MKSNFLLLLLIFIFFNAYSLEIDTSAVFVLSWYEGLCQHTQTTGGCDPHKLQLWDRQTFTIHGLQFNRDNKIKRSSSVEYGDFDLSIITQNYKLLDNMKNYWPPQSRNSENQYFLWEHEWEEYGHDYVNIIKNVQSHRFKDAKNLNRELQAAFYHDVIQIYKYGFSEKYPQQSFNKADLAKFFYISTDQFIINCVKSTAKVRQIKICGSIKQKGFEVNKCSQQLIIGKTPKTNYILPGWKLSKQNRVIQYTNTAKFAFSWYEGHCQNSKRHGKGGGCDQNKIKLWDHQSFTIHGLWPQKRSQFSYGQFNKKIITNDQQLFKDMKNYWPPSSKVNDLQNFLWEHEWNDHGHDYADIILKLQPHRFKEDKSNQKLQWAFFHDIIDFYKRISGAQRFPSATFNKQSLADIFKISPKQFTISCCSVDTIVREIKICLNITPSKIEIIQCQSIANSGCTYNAKEFILPKWALSHQKNVIDQSE